jgi:hypothetical protein
LETIIDRLTEDWSGLAEQLRDVLREHKAEDAPIEPTRDVAFVPWELGGALYRSSSRTQRRDYPASDRARPDAIHLLTPGDSEDGISITLESTSGSSLVEIYYPHGIKPATIQVTDAGTLKLLASGPPPVLMHIVAAMRDASGTPYLDFSSTRSRIETFGADIVRTETNLSASRLANFLANRSDPPFVILDITHPYNSVEAARMLLLRNRFATELFDYGATRGVLACGLSRPFERVALSATIVDALLSGPVISALHALRTGPAEDFESILSRHAVALWTNNPEDRLFSPQSPR